MNMRETLECLNHGIKCLTCGIRTKEQISALEVENRILTEALEKIAGMPEDSPPVLEVSKSMAKEALEKTKGRE